MTAVIAFLIRNYQMIAVTSLAMAFCWFLVQRGESICEDKHTKAAVKEETAYAKIEQKNMRLSDTELDRALCAHWMRRPCPKT